MIEKFEKSRSAHSSLLYKFGVNKALSVGDSVIDFECSYNPYLLNLLPIAAIFLAV